MIRVSLYADFIQIPLTVKRGRTLARARLELTNAQKRKTLRVHVHFARGLTVTRNGFGIGPTARAVWLPQVSPHMYSVCIFVWRVQRDGCSAKIMYA